jgi:hypothetical protein
MHWSITIVAIIALTGCISHRAVILNPAQQADQATIGGRVVAKLEDKDIVQEQLPLDLLVSAWRVRTEEQGTVYRYHGRCRTPLSWWQRFPCDFFTDVMTPRDLVCERTLEISCVAVAASGSDDWLARGRLDGYVHGDKAPSPAP